MQVFVLRFLLLVILVSPSFVMAELRGAAACAINEFRSKIYGITLDEEAELTQLDGNFFQLKPKGAAEINSLNLNALRRLNEEPIPATSKTKKATLTRREIEKLYQNISNNKQVKETVCSGEYNGSPTLGFCWGRAMAAHLKALQAGLPTASVRKIWAVGKLTWESDGKLNEWRYHVTTVVRGSDKKWYALDPIFSEVLPIEDWVKSMKKNYDRSGTTRIFATPAERFGPETIAKYDKNELVDKYYNGFFVDLMDTIHRENTGRAGYWSKVDEILEAKKIAKAAELAKSMEMAKAKALNDKDKLIKKRAAQAFGATALSATGSYILYRMIMDTAKKVE